jgi:hypothetical protein
VTIELQAVGDETDVSIIETAEKGPARIIPQPLLDAPLSWRNTETLRRLAYIAERRSAGNTFPE